MASQVALLIARGIETHGMIGVTLSEALAKETLAKGMLPTASPNPNDAPARSVQDNVNLMKKVYNLGKGGVGKVQQIVDFFDNLKS